MKNQKGFTLIEMVMTMIILAVIAGAAVPMLTGTYDAMGSFLNARDVEQDAQLALGRMTRDIRRVRQGSILLADNNTFHYNGTGGVVIYQIAAGGAQDLLERTGMPLATDIVGAQSSFTYFNDAGNQLPNPVPFANLGDIRRVQIVLFFRTTFPLAWGPPNWGAPQEFRLQTQVMLKNMNHNAYVN